MAAAKKPKATKGNARRRASENEGLRQAAQGGAHATVSQLKALSPVKVGASKQARHATRTACEFSAGVKVSRAKAGRSCQSDAERGGKGKRDIPAVRKCRKKLDGSLYLVEAVIAERSRVQGVSPVCLSRVSLLCVHPPSLCLHVPSELLRLPPHRLPLTRTLTASVLLLLDSLLPTQSPVSQHSLTQTGPAALHRPTGAGHVERLRHWLCDVGAKAQHPPRLRGEVQGRPTAQPRHLRYGLLNTYSRLLNTYSRPGIHKYHKCRVIPHLLSFSSRQRVRPSSLGIAPRACTILNKLLLLLLLLLPPTRP